MRNTEATIREVQDGDRLSGHGKSASGESPSLIVQDRPMGSMMFTIDSFHWVSVIKTPDETELWFEGSQRVTIHDGYVVYFDPVEPEKRAKRDGT